MPMARLRPSAPGGNTDGSTETVGSKLGNADGSTELVGSRLGSDEGLSDIDGTGLGRPEGPKVGKAEGLSDWVGAAEGKVEDMATERKGVLGNYDRIVCKVSELSCEMNECREQHPLSHAGRKNRDDELSSHSTSHTTTMAGSNYNLHLLHYSFG